MPTYARTIGLALCAAPIRARLCLLGTSGLSRRAPMYAALILGLAAAFAGSLSSATAAPALHSPQWLRKHCPIMVWVSLFSPSGWSAQQRAGVSLRGKRTEISVNGVGKFAVRYTWHLNRQDQFCGIVGAWPGPPRPKFVSLTPTAQTTHSGEYLDRSVEHLYGTHLEEFFVYARRRGDNAGVSANTLATTGAGLYESTLGAVPHGRTTHAACSRLDAESTCDTGCNPLATFR